jgi:hypothetical protein
MVSLTRLRQSKRLILDDLVSDHPADPGPQPTFRRRRRFQLTARRGESSQKPVAMVRCCWARQIDSGGFQFTVDCESMAA